ncbi:MAG: hypothetical protein GXO64_02070 [Candidatus Micrarchaeota archaeon]|nr:hypothetical protein [Candidatus Micrarchaeota archaeon]
MKCSSSTNSNVSRTEKLPLIYLKASGIRHRLHGAGNAGRPLTQVKTGENRNRLHGTGNAGRPLLQDEQSGIRNRLGGASKGQIWSTDFVVSILIMLAVLVPAFMLWNNIHIESTEQRLLYSATRSAFSITDTMMSTPGIPIEWNNTSVMSVGFASENNILDEYKINEFNKTNYQKLKNIFGYDFYFELKDANGTIYLTKGVAPPDTATVIPVKRRGLYTDRIVTLSFFIWY